VLLGALAGACLPLPLFADRVELDSGEIFTGKVLRVNDHEASIQLAGGGIISFSLSAIRSIRRSGDGEEESIVVYEKPSETPKVSPVQGALDASATVPQPRPLSPSATADSGSPPSARSGGEAPPAEAPKKTEEPGPAEEPAIFEAQGLSVCPPRGFLPWPAGKSPTIPLAFRDPVSRASLTIATYDTEDTPDEIKRNALRSCADQFKTFHVVRDALLAVPGIPAKSGARILEIECRIGNVLIRQTQVILQRRDKALVLTYSATGDAVESSRRGIARSLQSLRLSESAVDAPAPAAEAEIPRVLDTPPRAPAPETGTRDR
jgi:hypothetical protein